MSLFPFLICAGTNAAAGSGEFMETSGPLHCDDSLDVAATTSTPRSRPSAGSFAVYIIV